MIFAVYPDFINKTAQSLCDTRRKTIPGANSFAKDITKIVSEMNPYSPIWALLTDLGEDLKFDHYVSCF